MCNHWRTILEMDNKKKVNIILEKEGKEGEE